MVLACIWEDRNPVHPITVMVHRMSCGLVRRFGNGPAWRRFRSREAVEGQYGADVYVGKCCMKGEGPHLDRNLRRVHY